MLKDYFVVKGLHPHSAIIKSADYTVLCIQLFILSVETWEGCPVCVSHSEVCDGPAQLDAVVMVKDVSEGQKAPQQQQLAKQWNQHQEQGKNTHTNTELVEKGCCLLDLLTQPPSYVSL